MILCAFHSSNLSKLINSKAPTFARALEIQRSCLRDDSTSSNHIKEIVFVDGTYEWD